MNFKQVSDSSTLQSTYTLANGVTIPCLGFGTWQMPEGEVTEEAVCNAIQAGYRHIDTAQAYGNETSVGKGVKQSGVKREELFITTKLWNSRRGYEDTKAAIEESLEKLDMDYIDLFLIHWPNPIAFRDNWKEMNGESYRAIEEYYHSGKIKAIGISNFRPHHIDALLETATIVPMVNQIRLCPGDVETDIVDYCREKNILLEAYSPLGTGKALEVQELQDLGKKYSKSPAQVCIRWSLQMGFLPLPKTLNAGRIKENADVFDFNLTDEEVTLLANLTGKCGVSVDPDTAKF